MPHRLRTASRVVATLAAALVVVPALAAPSRAAAPLPRVLLKVLLVTDGSPSVEAVATQLGREGVPYDRLDTRVAGRPVVTAALLADSATATARYQGVVLPSSGGGGLAAAEVGALAAYEAAYGVRELDAYDYPGAATGFAAPTYAGSLDGATATVTAAGRAGGFGYLRGAVPVDDVDKGVLEVYGYLAGPSATPAAGEVFTPLVTATAGGATGVLAGVDAQGGRERLVLTAAYNPSMQWFGVLAPGLVSWLTRGVHLGLTRNSFAVHVDDVLLPDSRWSTTADCTPGDGCVDPTVTTPDVRMVPSDVDRLLAFQRSTGFRFDLAFNGGGSDAWRADHGTDPLADRLLADQASFRWLNHTSTHPFLGCIQVAPTVQGAPWTCATTPDAAPRQDPDVPQELSGGTYWASQAYVTSQVTDNVAWARSHGLTDFDPSELVTGEHSGLRTLPQQPVDNPFLAPALAAAGVRVTASDASREDGARAVGTATTLPRHPMNVFYNAATYTEEVDEYDWIYTRRADGGGGVCEDNPLTSTCIAPLPAATPAQARASFEGYVLPLEVRSALSSVLAGDVRPFYAHQSNLAEDGLLYPVVSGVLDAYAATYDTATTPLLSPDMTQASAELARRTAWTAAPTAVAYVDAAGVHVPAGTTAVPLTVPAGTRVAGAALQPYAGELSGWTTGAVDAVPPTASAGYAGLGAPGVPLSVSAVAGNASATVSWAPPTTSGAPLTGWVVRTYRAGVLSGTTTAAATARSLVVPGLTNGVRYAFDVAAVNAAGTGPASARTAEVLPLPPGVVVPGAPTGVSASGSLFGQFFGRLTASVAWSAPASTGGSPITGYVVTASQVSSTGAVLRTTTATLTGTGRSTTMTLPAVGSYRFTVAATNLAGTGAPSTPTGLVRVS